MLANDQSFGALLIDHRGFWLRDIRKFLDLGMGFGYFKWTRIGGIAQLGERLDGIEKVRGSSPLASIFVKGRDVKASWPF